MYNTDSSSFIKIIYNLYISQVLTLLLKGWHGVLSSFFISIFSMIIVKLEELLNFSFYIRYMLSYSEYFSKHVVIELSSSFSGSIS